MEKQKKKDARKVSRLSRMDKANSGSLSEGAVSAVHGDA